MSALNKLEARFGRFAIPGLIQIIAILQLVTLGIVTFMPPESRGLFQQFLGLEAEGVLRGEVWRLFSYVLLMPPGNLFFSVIGAMFMMSLGRTLEETWGAFRVNLYVIGGILCLAAGAVLLGYQADARWLYLNVLFAIASLYPNEEINI